MLLVAFVPKYVTPPHPARRDVVPPAPHIAAQMPCHAPKPTTPAGRSSISFWLFSKYDTSASLKASKALEPVHFSVVRSYMKAANVNAKLLLNFAAMPLTVKRVGRAHPIPS
jgi:hypothetical protein